MVEFNVARRKTSLVASTRFLEAATRNLYRSVISILVDLISYILVPSSVNGHFPYRVDTKYASLSKCLEKTFGLCHCVVYLDIHLVYIFS